MRKLNTIFEWCNDIVSTRHFYTELLGLDETFYDEGRGWLNYRVGETLLVICRAPHPLPTTDEWAVTPAYEGGTAYLSSWVIEVGPDELTGLASRLSAAGVESWGESDDSPGGQAFFVRDPMGKTVEVFCAE